MPKSWWSKTLLSDATTIGIGTRGEAIQHGPRHGTTADSSLPMQFDYYSCRCLKAHPIRLYLTLRYTESAIVRNPGTMQCEDGLKLLVRPRLNYGIVPAWRAVSGNQDEAIHSA